MMALEEMKRRPAFSRLLIMAINHGVNEPAARAYLRVKDERPSWVFTGVLWTLCSFPG